MRLQPLQGNLNGLSAVVIEFGTLHAGHSIIGNVELVIAVGTNPFLRGLAIAVIIHIVVEVAAITPTVNGGYARYSDKNATGMRTISIHNALRRLFLVR